MLISKFAKNISFAMDQFGLPDHGPVGKEAQGLHGFAMPDPYGVGHFTESLLPDNPT